MKNKRIILVVLSVVISIAMIVSMGGCSLLEIILGGSSGTISDDSIEITVYNDDTPATFKVKSGEENKITAFTKPGYYLTGYYSEKSGGTKYFDTEGKSVSIWQKTNPTTLYAQWNEIANLDKYESQIYYESNTLKYTWDNSKFIDFDLPTNYINAVRGNFEEEFDIVVKFKFKSSNGIIVSMLVCDKTSNDREYFGSQKFNIEGNNYIDFEAKYTVKASAFKYGQVVFMSYMNGGMFDEGYLKEISCTVQYHQPSNDDVTE